MTDSSQTSTVSNESKEHLAGAAVAPRYLSTEGRASTYSSSGSSSASRGGQLHVIHTCASDVAHILVFVHTATFTCKVMVLILESLSRSGYTRRILHSSEAFNATLILVTVSIPPLLSLANTNTVCFATTLHRQGTCCQRAKFRDTRTKAYFSMYVWSTVILVC